MFYRSDSNVPTGKTPYLKNRIVLIDILGFLISNYNH